MASDVEDIAAELRSRALVAPDATGYFAAVYARETAQIGRDLAQLDAGDRRLVGALTRAFVDRYCEAADDEAGRAKSWQACWSVAADPELLIVQHLLLGINAHVNLDLPQALVRTAADVGGLDVLRPIFDLVERSFVATYADVIKDLDLVARWTSRVAFLGGGRPFHFSLHHARRQAWLAAERLVLLGPQEQGRYVRELDELVSVLAYLITRPPFPVRMAAKLVRRLERDDPKEVTAALLGSR